MSEEGKIESVMHEQRKFNPSNEFSEKAHVKSMDQYWDEYNRSMSDPAAYWADKAEQLHWFRKWDNVLRVDQNFSKWFEGGKINVCYNCVDRYLNTWRRNKAAFIWQGHDDDDVRTYTYQEVYTEVCKFANVLKKKGAKKGDRVCFYLPMVPELVIGMLACARIGAVHSIVFGGFSAESLKDRVNDSEARIVITVDGSVRGGKTIPLKNSVDAAMIGCPGVKSVIVVKRAGNKINFYSPRDSWWHDEMHSEDIKPDCPVEEMDAEDPLFILYTSGTTGKPKGVLHTQAGYLLYVHQTFRWVFDHRDEDVFWCSADIGWITGHSYIVYGPLSNGSTSVIFEDIPTYPNPGRFWQIVEKFKVNVFYTAPTVIRALEREGDEWPNKYDLSSLRLLGTVGEPINPEAWMWYHRVIGKQRCPIVDTWWQTETGGILITPLPGATPTKPGSATLPFPGIEAAIYREDGTEAAPDEGGYLVIKRPWPSMLRTVWGNPERYKKTYYGKFKDVYLTGDGAKKDKEGYFWIMGRLDDVINVSGHRIGTAEVESALVSHDKVAEAAVVPVPHEIKGQALFAFVILNAGVEKTDELKKELRNHVGTQIGHIAKPDAIEFSDALPKTRSGKIMRRILRAIAEGKEDVGNITTLANPEVVQRLIDQRKKN